MFWRLNRSDWSMPDQLAADTCNSNQTIVDSIEISLLLVLARTDWMVLVIVLWNYSDLIVQNSRFVCNTKKKTRTHAKRSIWSVALFRINWIYVYSVYSVHCISNVIMMQAIDELGRKSRDMTQHARVNIMNCIHNLLP